MIKIVKYSLAAVLLTSSSFINAAALMQAPAPVPTTPVCVGGEAVTIPCERMGWQVGAEFIYVQPVGAEQFSDGESLDWAPGFKLEAAYLFDNGNDININWTYFKKTSDRDNVRFVNLIDRDERIKDTFNAVNAEFGQRINWSEAAKGRFHAGMQYVNIKRDTRFADTLVPDSPLTNDNFEKKFQGFGPRVGLEGEYGFTDSGLAIFGEAATSLLIGNAKYRDRIEPELNNSTRNIVPGAEARVGGKYTFEFGQQSLSIQGGYQWAGYFNSMQDALGNQDNYGYHGLFVGLNWQGEGFLA